MLSFANLIYFDLQIHLKSRALFFPAKDPTLKPPLIFSLTTKFQETLQIFLVSDVLTQRNLHLIDVII